MADAERTTIKKTMEYDEAKMRSLLQLGEFRGERDLLNFALALAKWYLVHKAEGWDITAKKGDKIKTPQLRGI